VLNLVGTGAEVGGFLLGSCGPNEHSFWGSGWSDSPQRVERFAPKGSARQAADAGAIRAESVQYACKQRPAATWLVQKVWLSSFCVGIGMPFAVQVV
jgi:hypothetical protein